MSPTHSIISPSSQRSYINKTHAHSPPNAPAKYNNNLHPSSLTRSPMAVCFTTLLKFIISFIVTIGIIVLVLAVVFRPRRIQVHVESASLTQFNLTNTNTNASLAYNLTMDISVRNPNRRIAIYYDRIEACAIYDGYRFGYDSLPTFYQGHKNTTTLHPEFQGRQPALGSVVGTFEREKGEGSFYLQVKLYTKLRMKRVKFGHRKPKIDCVVKLPVPSSKGPSSASFERTKCDVNWNRF